MNDIVSLAVNKNLKAVSFKQKIKRDRKKDFRNENLFKRLFELKNLNFLPNEESRHKLYLALYDNLDSVRYWIVLGIHYKSISADEISKSKKFFNNLVNDEFPVIRIAFAHALYDWNEETMANPFLINEPEHPLESVRFQALTVLDAIGDKIKPFAYQIKNMIKPDVDTYDQKVLKHASESTKVRL